jgi:type II secretory pathway pseudopilin PulG
MRAGSIAIIMTLLLTVSAGALQGPAKTPPKGAQSQAARPSASTAKKKPPTNSKSDPDMAWLQDALKNPDLMKEVNHLTERLAKELQYPAVRTQSAVLARLPQNTLFYGAISNFGPQLRQSLEIFRQELHDSAALRDFLQKNHLDASEPKVEDGIAKFDEFLDYLGDELVITGGLNGKDPNGVLIAEIKKPGLRAFLETIAQELNGKSADHVRIFDPQQLEAATDHPGEGPVVLIRPDFILISINTATLREFNAQLDKGGSSFASSQLGKRLAQSYQAGTNTIIGVDTHRLMRLIPANQVQATALLEKSGFGDANYAIMDSRLSGDRANTQMELVFSGPRRGVASWIATPSQLGALDFVSPKSAVAEVFRLKGPAQIFDDIVEIAGPGALAMLPQMEAQLNIKVKQDVLSKLTGEIGFAIQTPPFPAEAPAQGMTAAQPNFTVILGVNDAAGLQQTIKRLLTQVPLQSGEKQEDGVTFNTLTAPSANGTPAEFNYFFMDGYMVITTNHELAQDAVRVHRSGESLAKSSQVAASSGQPVKASALVYQNMGSMFASMLKQLPPETAGALPKLLGSGESKPTVFLAYADDNTLRATTSNSISTNASFGWIAAAIAIPNLMRSRTAANESAAASTVRTVNTAEITYATSYPQKGYARTLAVMGPGASGDCAGTNANAVHACLLDDVVGNSTCIAGKWCEKNGYRFSVRGICLQTSCRGYVVTATPVSENTGGKSFCSTTDAVIRSHTGPPVTAPLSAAECKAWTPLQ